MLNFKIVISEFVKNGYHAISFLLSDLQVLFEGVETYSDYCIEQ